MASVIDNLSLKKALRKKIFNKWINITAHAFLRHGYKLKKKNTHSTELKLPQSLSQKGEPATRKTLSFRKM